MALMTWSTQLSVGVAELDLQHQRLVAMLNELHDTMSKGQGKTVVQPVLARLVQYTVMHFQTEERMMRAANYVGIDAHAAVHTALTKQVQEFQKRFVAGELNLSINLINFLRDWVVKHIQGTDKQYTNALTGTTARC
jgi:hemerythrin